VNYVHVAYVCSVFGQHAHELVECPRLVLHSDQHSVFHRACLASAANFRFTRARGSRDKGAEVPIAPVRSELHLHNPGQTVLSSHLHACD
jgi:sirohydrochlorin ferrochelatase